jgi:sterol desaturase/sphingolipid hydroxylase (fatty acid hydroxylase superfamily)
MDWRTFQDVWLWRWLIFGVIAIATWETVAPRMTLLMPATRRWAANFGLYGLLAVCSYLFIGSGMVGVALWAQHKPWGLLRHDWIPFAAQWIAGFLLYDFADYWGHRWSHEVKVLWRIHHVHHSDPDCDFTTSFRFHPLEFLFGQVCAISLIALFAPPVSAVVASVFAFAVVSVTTHSNGRIPEKLDRALRWILITPDTHRTHHSADYRHQFGNYATVLSIWDRLFGTYIQPVHDIAEFGLPEVDPDRAIHLPSMLIDPFVVTLPDIEPGTQTRQASPLAATPNSPF